MGDDVSMKHVCFDCGHSVAAHSGEYLGWDTRGIPRKERPPKDPGEGCSECDCRRWFAHPEVSK